LETPASPVAKNFESQPSAGKIMLTLFWDMEGEILVHFTPKSETANRFPHVGANVKSSKKKKKKKIFIR
jgi:hypothetical protein